MRCATVAVSHVLAPQRFQDSNLLFLQFPSRNGRKVFQFETPALSVMLSPEYVGYSRLAKDGMVGESVS